MERLVRSRLIPSLGNRSRRWARLVPEVLHLRGEIGLTWAVQYNKKSDSVVYDIVMSKLKSEHRALASVPENTCGDEVSSGNNDHKGHQWIMDTTCGSDLISKAKEQPAYLRKSKAKNPIQFQTEWQH